MEPKRRPRRSIGSGALVLAGIALLSVGCGPTGPARREVVVYTSLDQELSEPILKRYEARTGVRVLAVYDTEATKTTGLANRLLAERQSPRADVFWNSEFVRTIVLKRAGILAPYRSPSASDIPAAFKDPQGYWTGFAARARVIAVSTRLLANRDEWPRGLEALLDSRWHGRLAMAYPLFGTTGTHAAALFARWGPERAKVWLRAIRDNGVQIVDGNSTARDRVAAGVLPVALTDSDDAAVAIARGQPVAIIFPDADGEGTLVIPNTVALVAGGPHPDEGRAFVDFVLSREVEQALSEAEGAQIPVREGIPWPSLLPPRAMLRAIDVDYEEVADRLEEAIAFCRDTFVR